MPDVSIIIPVYNVEAYVAECLQSVMSQKTECSIECLIIDDRGPDNSMAVVKESIASYCGPIEFKIIEREKNGGLSAARNSGIRAARGNYIYFLDSDDIITPDCIESLYTRVKEHPTVQIVTGDLQTFPKPDIHKDISLQGKQFPEFSEDIKWIRSIFLTKFPVIACNKLISTDFIIKNNLFFKEGILHEDNHWQTLAFHYVSSVAFVEKTTYLYRLRPGSITLSEGVLQRRITNLKIAYDDILSRKLTWDQIWDEWLFNSIADFKYNESWHDVKDEAEKTWKSIALRSARNSSCPLPLRLVYLYMTFPKMLRWDRLLFGSYFRLHKRLPKCCNPLR